MLITIATGGILSNHSHEHLTCHFLIRDVGFLLSKIALAVQPLSVVAISYLNKHFHFNNFCWLTSYTDIRELLLLAWLLFAAGAGDRQNSSRSFRIIFLHECFVCNFFCYIFEVKKKVVQMLSHCHSIEMNRCVQSYLSFFSELFATWNTNRCTKLWKISMI